MLWSSKSWNYLFPPLATPFLHKNLSFQKKKQWPTMYTMSRRNMTKRFPCSSWNFSSFLHFDFLILQQIYKQPNHNARGDAILNQVLNTFYRMCKQDTPPTLLQLSTSCKSSWLCLRHNWFMSECVIAEAIKLLFDCFPTKLISNWFKSHLWTVYMFIYPCIAFVVTIIICAFPKSSQSVCTVTMCMYYSNDSNILTLYYDQPSMLLGNQF